MITKTSTDIALKGSAKKKTRRNDLEFSFMFLADWVTSVTQTFKLK